MECEITRLDETICKRPLKCKFDNYEKKKLKFIIHKSYRNNMKDENIRMEKFL